MENNIILIGFMGAGKSSVAKHLSELLGFSWIEMDALVCEKTRSKTMHEVFEKGESYCSEKQKLRWEKNMR